jgi:hypothetical protein
MRRILALSLLGSLAAAALSADVSIVEHRQLHAKSTSVGKTKVEHGRRVAPPGRATGSQALIDAQGLKYFINTNITFSTSSSASAAMSEASFTHAVNASTVGGGTVSSTLNDAFDGYNTICLSLNNTVATCETGNANFVIYNKNGPATSECLGTTSGVNRQIVFPVQTSGSINMQRKVFVPDNDQFARWMNIFTNTGGTTQTVTMVVANNLGSDANTTIVSSSSGDATVDTSDTWASSFQNFNPTTSSDPRLGHVFQGLGSQTPLAGIHFVNGDDNPFWGYTFQLAPGQTKVILNFVTGQPTKAAANSKAAELATLPANALQCLSSAERAAIVNFNVPAPIPTLSGTGLVALGLLLATFAVVSLRRRRAA